MKTLTAVGLGLVAAMTIGCATRAEPVETTPVTAIDILIEPDAAMLRQAQTANTRLLKVFPAGFPLDEAHRPHVTLIQRFVRTGDLDRVYAVTERIIASAHVQEMKLEAFEYNYTPGGDVGVACIFVRSTPELLKLQQALIEALTPFTVETGQIDAFTADHGDPATDAALISYVTTFVPKQTGEHFQPHVSVGVAPTAYLDAMVAEPFQPFTFRPVGAAIYQLGPFGTAAKRLKAWPQTP